MEIKTQEVLPKIANRKNRNLKTPTNNISKYSQQSINFKEAKHNMIYLYKILPTIVLPIMLVIILILIGLIKNKKKLIYIAIGVLYIISTTIFSNNFFKLIEGSEYSKAISATDSGDAIVVLSGMLEINELGDSTYIEWGDPDRFFGGIALFKAGKAQKLVFTGGKMPWDKAKKTEGEVLKEYAISNGIPTEKIFVTKDVENTADEAVAVKELIDQRKRIILVTSAYHMFRAQHLFEKQGFKVIPYKVDYKTAGEKAITVMDFLPSAGNLELSERGIREIFGRIFYLLND
jgi:uncharacterized SAM-binding protein YcdF (DUF218 family)